MPATAMARVVFTQNLQRHVNCPPAQASGATVREVLDRVFAANPQARGYVLDEHGKLRKHMTIYVNGEAISDRIGLSDRVSEGSEIYVMQALSGG
jgi:molybdopterin converting factor small subunit